MICVKAMCRKAIRIIITTLILVLLVCNIACDLLEDRSEGKAVQEDLEREFKLIRPLPQAGSCDYQASHKSSQAYVGSSYQTQSAYNEIRAHYDKELLKNGWKLQSEESTHNWGRDYGGWTANYCKGQYQASLHHPGNDPGTGWAYALDLSWGLGSSNKHCGSNPR
ncbi:MAG: hypothetical protein ABI977_13665 [Acidobacteriota bacterium]